MSRRGDKVSAFDALKGLGELSELTPVVEEPIREGGVVSLPIENIVPDPIQARRVLPAELRRRFLVGELSPIEVLQTWHDLAEKDENEAEMLDGQIVRLARSLQAQEQINPITVSCLPDEGRQRYLIETGERRWWAHWWLVGVEANHNFEQIQAVVVEKASPWRQAAENLHGEPLSAVQEACQVARLLLVVAGVEPEYAVEWGQTGVMVNLAHSDVGYGFYRQAVEKRAPHGAWSLVEQATGKGARYCQYLLGLLRLDDAVLELADRTGLTEAQLRPLVNENDSSRQLRIAQLLVKFQLSREEATRLVKTADLQAAEDKLSERYSQTRKPSTIRPPERIVMDRLSSMTRLLDRASRSEPAIVQAIASEIRRQDQFEDRRTELQNLNGFLSKLLAELEEAG